MFKKNTIDDPIDLEGLKKNGLGQLSSHLPGVFKIVYNWQNISEEKSCLSGEALGMIWDGIIQKWISVTDSLRIGFEITKALHSFFTPFYFSLSSPFSRELRSQYEMSFVHHRNDFHL